ncbi:MAG: DUF2331 family protein [Burkholderiales bacterium]|nr:MAG: DUF2331 family protein [Burkholderiales bacterium]
MLHASWDLFTSRQAPSSLWFGYQLARSLAHRGQSMRLFTDELAELSSSVAGVHPTRFMQIHQGLEIIDRRMADFTPVAPVAIQMLDAPLPAGYRTRLAQQLSPTRCLQVVPHSDDAWPGLSPLHTVAVEGRCTHLVAQFGDAPLKAGYIKQRSVLPSVQHLWGRAAAQTGLLQTLGLRADLLDGCLAVFLDVRDPSGITPLLEGLADSPRPVCAFIDDHALQAAQRPASLPWGRERQGQTDALTHGALTVVALPTRRWRMVDALIETVDLVMTSESDTAMRSSACGIPVAWCCTDRDSGFFDWYTVRSGPVIRRTLAALFGALTSGEDVKSAWNLYLARWDEAQSLAALVAQRIRRAPDLADVLRASLTDDDVETVVRQFAPTQPSMALAGYGPPTVLNPARSGWAGKVASPQALLSPWNTPAISSSSQPRVEPASPAS